MPRLFSLLLAGLLAAAPRYVRAAEGALDAAAPEGVAATVNGQPIPAAEVQAELAAILGGRQVDPRSLASFQAEVLDQLIERRVIVAMLARRARSCGEGRGGCRVRPASCRGRRA